MKIKDYLKERWHVWVFAAAAALFAWAVMSLSGEAFKDNSDFKYLTFGIISLFCLFLILDYGIFLVRIRRIEKTIVGECEREDFYYPLDQQYIKKLSEVVRDYNQYRAQVAGESAEEIDFITKWIHDVKVPIAAMRLILEQGSEGMGEQLDMELTRIEQNTQTVLYHIKSNSFYDDFKIAETKVSKLVHAALKPFAVFFAVKALTLEMPKNDGAVLTDEKWSAYILTQLISNAVQHTHKKGRIAIKVEKADGQISVTIQNNGDGIKPNEIAHVFDKGYTSYDGRAYNKATGYGLYLAKKLADKLGHTLVCTSQKGAYTAFSLVFSVLADTNLSNL